MLFVFCNHVIAMEVVDWDNSNVEERINQTEADSVERENEELEDEEEPSVGSTDEDIAKEDSSNASVNTKTVTSFASQPTATYSTIATIPEANLSLNNILNVILIAVGVIIILL